MMRNPFIVGREIKYGETFCDRDEEISGLIARAKSSESVCLIGLRRFGKSSLVNQVIGKLEDEDWIGIKVDLMGVTSVEEFCINIEREIYKVRKSFKHRVEQLARSYKPKLSFGVDPISGLPSLDLALSSQTSARDELLLEKTLNICMELPEKTKRPFLLVFDEFQEIRRFSKDGKVEGIIRKIFQKREYDFVPFYLGSKRNMLRLMFQKESEPFFRSASIRELAEIPRDAYTEFVTDQTIKTLGISPDQDFLEKVWQIFRGHPYALLKTANRFWFSCIQDENLNQQTTWPEIVTSIILEERYFYEALNRNIPPYVLKTLTAIAKNEPVKNPYQENFLKSVSETSSRLQKALNLLLKEDKVEKTEKGYSVVDPMEKVWALTVRTGQEELLDSIEEVLF